MTDRTSKDESQERAAFEAWWRESQSWPPRCPLPTLVGKDRRYELGYMQFMWLGWLGRSSRVETPDEQTCQHMVTVLWRSFNRLHIAVKECARIGFQESAPTSNPQHFAIWTDLNDAQKDAELKLKHFAAGLPVKTSDQSSGRIEKQEPLT